MRPIRQTTINVCSIGFLCVALPLLALGGYALRASVRNVSAAAQWELATILLGEDMNAASDYLSDQVRAFAVTRDRASLDAYWFEVNSAKRREAAILEAEARGLPNEETALLAGAKRESDLLVETETRAMRLVAEALGYDSRDLPTAVAAASLSPADRALSPGGKIDLARELVFGLAYWEHKRAIRKAVAEYRSLSHAQAAEATLAAQTAADRAFALVTALSFLTLLGGAIVIVLYYRLVALPVRDYIRTLSRNEPVTGNAELEPEGSYELVSLAEAINLRRAQRLRAEQALRDSEFRLRTNLRLMPLAAIETDASNRILSWNLAAEKLFGYSTEEALGREVVELIVPERFRATINDFIDRLNTGEASNQNINANLTKDGREIVCEWRNAPLYDSSGTWIGWASLVKDITEEHAEAERILYLSRHDPLTGLLNRRSVMEKLEEEGQRCKRTGGRYATIMLDVDKFKDFNDLHGHECGDLVLKGIAEAMSATVRATDSVSRWGGEEFLILLPDTSAEGSFLLAEKIRKRIEEKEIAFGAELFKVTVTAGIAVFRGGEDGPGDCVRRADKALFMGKAQGRNRVVAAS